MSDMPRIIALGTATPSRRYSQQEVYEFAAAHVETYRNPRIKQLFMSSDIDYRHFSFDFETLDPEESADALHSRFAEHSVRLSREAVERCLTAGGIDIREVDSIIVATCTGYLCPGLSSILVRELGMRTDIQRADLVGMGCAGAMPGLQRAFDFVRAYPERKALLVTVEICSACYYIDDSLETVVGNAICADGAAAVLVGMDEGRTPASECGPEIVRFETLLEPSYIDTVGFEFKAGKLRIVLSKDIRAIAGGLAKRVIETLLSRERLGNQDIAHWVVHSGGRKVIDGIKDALALEEARLLSSRCVLRNFGNMSSPTVLFVLQDVQRRNNPELGDLGVMLAMGPGLAIEAALVRW